MVSGHASCCRRARSTVIVVKPARLNNEARLREVVRLANETLPVLRSTLAAYRDEVTPSALNRLEDQHRAHRRLLTLALYILSNLPDDPQERAERLVSTLRLCSDLTRQV
jgi:hypothetical protein